jgi:hypothetical protein
VTWAVRLILAGLIVNTLWLAGARFLPYTVPTLVLPAVPLALAALGAMVLLFWRPDAARIAALTDQRLGFKERITTAIELERRKLDPENPPTPSAQLMGDLQLSDAVSHIRQVEPLEAFPIRLRLREVNGALLAVLLVVALVVWPNPMQQTVRQRDQLAQTIRQEAERLERAADQIAAQNIDNNEELRQVEQALRDAAKSLEQRAGSGEEALAALAALEQRLQALRAQGGEEVQDALSAMAGSMAQDPRTRDAGTSLARGDYKQAAEQMRQIGQNMDQMSPQERARLARSMRQAGQRAQRSNPQMAQGLQQASSGMESGDSAQAQEGMNQAADSLEQASGQLRASSERERAAAQAQQSRSQIGRASQQGQPQQARGNQNQQGQQGQPGQQGQGQQGQQGQGQQGQQGQGQQGQGQQGQGQQGQGQGQGQSQQGGDGQGEDGEGQGQGQGGQPGSQSGGEGTEGGGSGAGSGSNPRSDAIYDPVFASSRQERLNPDGEFSPTDAIENPNPEEGIRNDAQVGYQQVHAQYQAQAVESMQNNYIPIGLKDLVKDYFTSLTPGQEPGR